MASPNSSRSKSAAFLTCVIGIAGWTMPDPTSAASTIPGVRSISPVPGSRLLLPETNIIVRLERTLGPTVYVLPSSFVVTGSSSGRHDGRIVRANDGLTVIFNPSRPFAYGEEVTVELRPPMKPGPEQAVFSFSITPRRTAVPASLAAELADSPDGSRLLGGPIGPSADTLPEGFPPIEHTVFDAAAIGQGVLFLSNISFGPPTANFLIILDRAGTPIFTRRMPGSALDFKVQANGLMTYMLPANGKLYVMDWTFTEVDSFACGNGYFLDPHEAILLPNGNALVMIYDPQPVDMSAVVPGGHPHATVVGLVLQEVDNQQNVHFQWRSWDHFEITDASNEDLTAAHIDYVHGNAIEIDVDGNLLISSRHLDEITKIDRETGDVLWRWGGKRNQFAFVGDPLGFNRQHAIRLLPNGHYTLWDNGNSRHPPFSRALEYALDQEARVAQLVWEHRESPDVFAGAMGYVQRLPNGNTLIAQGSGKPDIFEVTPDGRKVMQVTLPPSIYTYRAYRQTLPQPPPPPDTRTFQLLSGAVPNPFQDRATVTLRLSNPSPVTLVLYDLSGREVKRILDNTMLSAGLQPVTIDLAAGPPAGLYFLKATMAGRTETRKVLLIP